MKRIVYNTALITILLLVFSCNEPKTVVTNIVHPDGSVLRKIEMRNNKNIFELDYLQVPFDSTWLIKDTIIIGEKKDTTWIKTAEKLFKNVEEIDNSYLADKGANKDYLRKAKFIKKFRWFNTEYRFSEWVDRRLSHGYPIKDFLNQEELNLFYSPESMVSEKRNSPDSLKYKAIEDSIKSKTDKWVIKNIISEWTWEFTRLSKGKTGSELSIEALKAHEAEFVKITEANLDKFDSLWAKGIILKEFIGEQNSVRFKTEADSAMKLVDEVGLGNFKDYSVKIIMPGKVIGTNGFIDKTEALLWPVKSDYFMTEEYEMWAESKVINIWAWAVTGAFILFVIAGLTIRLFRK